MQSQFAPELAQAQTLAKAAQSYPAQQSEAQRTEPKLRVSRSRVGRWLGIHVGLCLAGALAVAACGGAKPADAKSGAHPEQHDGEGTDSAADAEDGTSADSAGEPAAAADLPSVDQNKHLEEKRAMSARIKLTLKGEDGSAAGMSDESWSFAEDRRAALEKASGAKITQMSVLYGQRSKSGLESWTTLATEGKGYDVRAGDGEPRVLDNGKRNATSEEREIVLAEYGFVGKANPLLVAATQAEKSGDAQRLGLPATAALLGHVPELRLDQVQIRHTGTAEREGRSTIDLEVAVEGSLADSGTNYKYTLKGPASVDAKTGFVVVLALEGPVRAQGSVTVKGKKLAATGEGKMTFTRSGTIK
jgi:hypothetical protein